MSNILYIPGYVQNESIIKYNYTPYSKDPDGTVTNSKLDVLFEWKNRKPNESGRINTQYIDGQKKIVDDILKNGLNQEGTIKFTDSTNTLRQYVELRKIIQNTNQSDIDNGIDDGNTYPFHKNNYVVIGEGYKSAYSKLQTTNLKTGLLLDQNMVIKDPYLKEDDGSNVSYEPVSPVPIKIRHDYYGPERRYIEGKLINKPGYDRDVDSITGIFNFSLDDSPYYNKSTKEFEIDGKKITAKVFIDDYVIKQKWINDTDELDGFAWDRPTGYTIRVNKPDTNKYSTVSNDDIKKILPYYENSDRSPSPIELINKHPEYILRKNDSINSFYDEANNSINLYAYYYNKNHFSETRTNLDYVADIGDIIKIDIIPLLEPKTFYYLTISNNIKYVPEKVINPALISNITTYVKVLGVISGGDKYKTDLEPAKWSPFTLNTNQNDRFMVVDDNTLSRFYTIGQWEYPENPENRPNGLSSDYYNGEDPYDQSGNINLILKYHQSDTILESKKNTYNQLDFWNSGSEKDYYKDANYYPTNQKPPIFAWFQTPDWTLSLPDPPVIPSISFGLSYETYGSNTNPDSSGKVSANSTSPVVYTTKLSGHIFYPKMGVDNDGSPKLPNDVPEDAGFEYRPFGNGNWTSLKINNVLFSSGMVMSTDMKSYLTNLKPLDYVRVLPSDINNTRSIDFETGSIDLIASVTYEYRIWLKKKDGSIWYSDANNLPSKDATTTPVKSFLITTGAIDLTGFTTGAFKDANGFWYQIYNSWKKIEDQNRLSPYLTVREYEAGNSGIGVQITKNEINAQFPIHYFLNYIFTNDKNYQFRTVVENYYTYKNDTTSKISDLEMLTPWGERIKIDAPYLNMDTVPDTMKRMNLYTFSNINGHTDNGTKPKTFISSKSNPQNPITYVAKPYFGGQPKADSTVNVSGLNHVSISKTDWNIQGIATYNIMTQTTNGDVNIDKTQSIPFYHNSIPYAGRGWHYIEKELRFIWFDKIPPFNTNYIDELNSNFPIGGDSSDYYSTKESHIKYLKNNYISTYIPFQIFNISFDYTNNSDFGLTMYLGRTLPEINDNLKTNIEDLISKGFVKRVGKLDKSKNGVQKCEFVGLTGNQYLFFVADTIIDFDTPDNLNVNKFKDVTSGYKISGTTTYTYDKNCVIEISNFRSSGTYHKYNNRVFETVVNPAYKTHDLTNAAYSIRLGKGNDVFDSKTNIITVMNSKAGNGSIYSGIWENGVWNNGWRTDKTVREFISVGQFYSYNKDRVWRLTINGRKSSLSNFKKGDLVAISNVVGIDINEERKLLKKEYRVIDVTTTGIEVEIETDFPIRRFEKDSEEHRILVTKNIWLNGVFLNGYFNGVWNSGLFSGFPMITKMDASHWIDGVFNGGHFTSKKLKTSLSKVNSPITERVIYDGNSRLAINFENYHKFEKNDIISLTYSISNPPNTYILGSTIILSAEYDKKIITGLAWKPEYNDIVDLTINSKISDGLIQNFEFHSNNISSVTSLESLKQEAVFSYNSWIDVNYSNKSAVNIGRPQTFMDYSERAYSENNLYGYPTNDILSSSSIFRDSFSNTFRKYKLGRKYKIFKDYIGDASMFERSFDATNTKVGLDTFKELGWDPTIYTDTKTNINFKGTKDTNGFLVIEPLSNDSITKSYIEGLLGKTVSIKGVAVKLVDLNTKNYFYTTKTITLPANYGSGNLTTDSNYFTEIDQTNNIIKDEGWILDINSIPTENRTGFNVGFEISATQSSSVVFSRTPEPSSQGTPSQGKELKVVAKGNGGVLNLIKKQNNSLGDEETIPKLRYSMIEFELVDFKSNGSYTIIDNNGNTKPALHFNNINLVSRKVLNEIKSIPASYLPVYKNVNHLSTFGRKKQEFFFNKRNLLINFSGVGNLGYFNTEYMIDNLKIYEVDMIPFFQYFKNPSGRSGSINVSVQIPNTGTSPGLNDSIDRVVDAKTDNDIINHFISKLVLFNKPVPDSVNWRSDYAVYRTQITDKESDSNIYKK
jgi:hypothetical protein